MTLKLKITFYALAALLSKKLSAQEFIHPGLLTGKADIERIRQGLKNGAPDLKAGFEILKNSPQSQFGYKMMGPMEMVGRNPTIGQSTYDTDANAAYQNALMWTLTADHRYAEKAIEIVNAWSVALKQITGRDAVLMAGLGPFKMVNAAELLRYTDAGWKENDISRTKNHFKNIIYPVLETYAPFANGNWDSAAMKTIMAIAIFCDDREMFERVLCYYQKGAGDGRLTNYILNASGQCQESGRDQSHTQLGIAHLADCCEMAWHQGIDLYGLADNRLLQGFEYTSKYNLGYDVPFIATIDRTGKYRHEKISENGRGNLRAIYEEVFNHFVRRSGLAAPFTSQAAARIRPEPQGGPGADHIGMGTLLFTRPGKDPEQMRNAPFLPSGILAWSVGSYIRIEWPKVINAESYRIERASGPGGAFRLIPGKLTKNHFEDKNITAGNQYSYRVAAVNKFGHSVFSLSKTTFAGLPVGWAFEEKNIGQNLVANTTDTLFSTGSKRPSVSFDGKTFLISAVGKGIDSIGIYGTRVFTTGKGLKLLTMKVEPQFSSQTTQIGLFIQPEKQVNIDGIYLVLKPVKGPNAEAPVWKVQFLKRDKKSQIELLASSNELVGPAVTFSRVTGGIWFRLEHSGNKVAAAYSLDGKQWSHLGETKLEEAAKTSAGVFAASGSSQIDTEIKIGTLKCLK